VHDFDFLSGCWAVLHRRLRHRGIGSDEWDEFTGSAETRLLLDGLCNIEEHRIAGHDFSGVALRAFDRQTQLWSIYWVSDRDGRLQPPVTGRFAGDLGDFTGEDVDEVRPVRVRFLWDRSQSVSPRWAQSFSYDGGSSWETNWIMQFER
jgi:hypothetical protein